MTDDYVALAEHALRFVSDGSRIGLGTGRTVEEFIRRLGERVRQGLRVRGVPTSRATAALARSHGIPLDTLDADEPLAVTIDGADEVQRSTLDAIKGRGGAMVRERIVAAASEKQILIVTADKLVDRLGERGALPVEVLPFAAPFCRRRIEALPVADRLRPVLRGGDAPVVTDNGNWILDCAIGPLHDPRAVEAALREIPGIVGTGLFLGTAALVLVAHAGKVEEMSR